jgi:hypothetical protein
MLIFDFKVLEAAVAYFLIILKRVVPLSLLTDKNVVTYTTFLSLRQWFLRFSGA